MSSDRSVVVHSDAEELATATAARLINTVADAQADHRPVHIALTGGRIAATVYRHVLESPFRTAVNWNQVHFWWGDERFLPSGNADRNETQAREAFLDALEIDPEHVHPMPAADAVDTVEEAAAVYAEELNVAGHESRVMPHFDLILLGIGEDAHVASLFPGHKVLDEKEKSVVGVRTAPKPPSERTTLTFPVLNSATEVWVIASGGGKAEAVSSALEADDVPAAQVNGRTTRWLVDRDAAGDLHRFDF
ncbi:6-phosphogluconolactonase [Haloglycomyces albus]|uniref:6-phosphogluconolactonase n=1 Tax=Haloglycomyces albus TaxID=526067 RepID=UPI00046D04AB|nr:6-phosphogluconolactonase [Haloglycomyces albus]